MVHAGCMVYKDGHFLVQDQTTQEVIEISGPDLAANVGNRVEARGAASSAPAAAPATSAMNVASIAPQAQGGCLSVAAALGAETELPRTAAAPIGDAALRPADSPHGRGTPGCRPAKAHRRRGSGGASLPGAKVGMSTGSRRAGGAVSLRSGACIGVRADRAVHPAIFGAPAYL